MLRTTLFLLAPLVLALPGLAAAQPQQLATLKISPQTSPVSRDIWKGGGRVTSDPAGIDCVFTANVPSVKPPTVSGTCQAQFPLGTIVTLHATTDSTSQVPRWDSRQPGVNFYVLGDQRCRMTDDCKVTLNRFTTEMLVAFKLRLLFFSVRNNATGLGHVQQLGESDGERIYCGLSGPRQKETCESSGYWGRPLVLSLIPDKKGSRVRGLSRCTPNARPLPWPAGGACSTLLNYEGIVVSVYWED